MTQKNVPEGHKNQIYETDKKRPDQQKDKKQIYQKDAKNLPERHKSHDQPVTQKKKISTRNQKDQKCIMTDQTIINQRNHNYRFSCCSLNVWFLKARSWNCFCSCF